MDFCWHGFSFPVLGRGSLQPMRRLDAAVMRSDGEGEWEDASRTRWYFEQAASLDPYRIRRFVASAGLGQLSRGALPDLALVSAVNGDSWHAIATVALKAADAPRVRVRNAGTGTLVADAILLESQARWNDGSAVSSVTLDPMDAIVLHRSPGGCP